MFFDSNGEPLALGTLEYYVAGSSTLQDTWSDSAGTVANSHPIVLDGSGRIGVDIYLGSTGLSNYKETLRDSTGATVSPWPADNIPKASGSAGVSNDLSWTPASGNAALDITTGTGVTVPGATESLAGLLSASDKTKLDGLTGLYIAQASQVICKNNTLAPTTKLDCSTGATIMVDGNGAGAYSGSASGTIDFTQSGLANGNCLDTGTFGSGWYYIYQATNGTTVAFWASASSTSPTLPSGYTKFVRIGAVPADATPNLYRVQIDGRRGKYIITATSNTSTFPFVFTDNTSAWVSKTVAGVSVPLTAVDVDLVLTLGTAVATAYAAPNGSYNSSNTNPTPPLGVGAISGGNLAPRSSKRMLLETSAIYMYSTHISNLLEVLGWEDAVNALS